MASSRMLVCSRKGLSKWAMKSPDMPRVLPMLYESSYRRASSMAFACNRTVKERLWLRRLQTIAKYIHPRPICGNVPEQLSCVSIILRPITIKSLARGISQRDETRSQTARQMKSRNLNNISPYPRVEGKILTHLVKQQRTCPKS